MDFMKSVKIFLICGRTFKSLKKHSKKSLRALRKIFVCFAVIKNFTNFAFQKKREWQKYLRVFKVQEHRI